MNLVGRSSNGKTAASGAGYRGSNPCLPANCHPRRIVPMSLRTAFFLIPTLLMAQPPAADAPKPASPPTEVDQALRARAKEFLQFNVEGNYRKAYDMVAEDSKDFYFGMPKPKYLGFELTSIDYTDNFTKAMVKGLVRRTATFGVSGREVEIAIPSIDSWRLQDG